MTESCGTCENYTPSDEFGRDGAARRMTRPMFGNCEHQGKSDYMSEATKACRLDPSRYDPIDGIAAPRSEGALNTGLPEAGRNDQADADLGSDRPASDAATTEEPPPFELT